VMHRNLSGGEQQLLAIARIVVKKPRIVVFDEPTSSVDAITEKNLVDKAFKLVCDGRTTIIVT
jgi:ABC-type multidrug transport system fused ATPase/permease subunit